MLTLSALVEELRPNQVFNLNPRLGLSGVQCDSRRVERGNLFAALPGVQVDGARFTAQALERGAAAVLTEQPQDFGAASVPQLVVENARAAYTRAVRRFFGKPDEHLTMGAVTGTNGKSTVAYLIRHLLISERTPTGLLGTIEYDLGAYGRGPLTETIEERIHPAPLTTPAPHELFSALAHMQNNDCRACIMEVSSHGLDQRRVEGIEFQSAVFTNLTQDHLDYHGTMEAYRDAKGQLFQTLRPGAVAVLNFDDPAGHFYACRTRADVLGYSLDDHPDADLRAQLLKQDIHGMRFRIQSPWGCREVCWGMVGRHNLQNALAALGGAMALADRHCTFNFDYALRALARFKGVPGRLEAVEPPPGCAPGFRVFVDYAHTDDALSRVLQALRASRPRRIICVFGCGGDRDPLKRPKMARAAEKGADVVVLTSDNPRTEDPLKIIEDARKGFQRPEEAWVETDRATAIRKAIHLAEARDIVLIAGKGHENYQIIGTEKQPFDDRAHAYAAFQERYK